MTLGRMNTPHKQAVSSTYEVGERLAMTEVDSGDTTYTAGKLYTKLKSWRGLISSETDSSCHQEGKLSLFLCNCERL